MVEGLSILAIITADLEHLADINRNHCPALATALVSSAVTIETHYIARKDRASGSAYEL